MTKKTWLIFGVLCVALIAGMIALSNGNKIDVSNVDQNVVQSANAKNGNIADHTYGNMRSKVIMFEYGDLQCPGCGQAHPIIKAVVEKYKDQMGFVFRNFPLYQAHPNAFAASSAIEAAGLQGKYWEMHNKLFESQSAWSSLTGEARTNYFAQAADSLGLDSAKLRSQLDDPNIKRKIDYDTALGKKAGVTGTPSFYIDGKNVGELYIKDDKVVDKGTKDAVIVWSSQAYFEKFVIVPALKARGIALPQEQPQQ